MQNDFSKGASKVVHRLTWNTITIHCFFLNTYYLYLFFFKYLLFEQFFPTNPGTQVQL